MFRLLVSMFRRRGTGENTFYENEKITSFAVNYETTKTDEKMDKFFQQTMKEGTSDCKVQLKAVSCFCW